MGAKGEVLPRLIAPGDAAASLGVTTAELVALIQHHRCAYTERKAGAKLGVRGRPKWGLSPDQLAAVRQHMVRRPPAPAEEAARQAPPAASPDGVSRLRRRVRHGRG